MADPYDFDAPRFADLTKEPSSDDIMTQADAVWFGEFSPIC